MDIKVGDRVRVIRQTVKIWAPVGTIGRVKCVFPSWLRLDDWVSILPVTSHCAVIALVRDVEFF